MSIFNDVVENISKEVSKVQERSQEMLQGFNINTQIRDLERKKTKMLSELGSLIVDKYHHEKEISEELVKEKVAEVVGYEDQIEILKAELEAQNVERDPKASRSKKAAAKAGYKSTPGFRCPDCGTPASRDKKFCPACGGQLEEDKSSYSEGPLDVEPEEDDDLSDDPSETVSKDNGDKKEKKDKDEDD